MTHKRLLVAVVLLAAGCSKPKSSVVGKWEDSTGREGIVVKDSGGQFHLKPSHEAQVYAELGRICKEKGLKYDVYCYSGHCNADAWDSSVSWATRQLHGSSWQVGSWFGPTKAAEDLIEALKRPPNLGSWESNGATFETREVKP